MKRSVDTPHPWIYSYYSFRDEHVRTALRAFKYYRKTNIGKRLTSHIIDSELRTFLAGMPQPYLVPIPMNTFRKWSRGNDHTHFIAQELAHELAIPLLEGLVLRNLNTKQQAKTSTRSEREKSIHGAFKVNTTLLAQNISLLERTIILIDDITTTGATLREAKKMLEKAGFKNVLAITLAH